MFVDAVPFLEASFPTSPPTVLDVAGRRVSSVLFNCYLSCLVGSI
jgi:hypothetical protein